MYRAIVSVCVVTFLICSIVRGSIIDDIGRNKVRARQFPQLSFALPALGLLGGQSRSNLFGKSTVTRTLLSTVSTITVASFRTCTTSAAALMACGRRRRRDAEGNEIDASPSIKLIIGTTEISDPASVEAFFAENAPAIKSEVDMDNAVETTTTSSSVQRDLDGTTILYPSQDDEGSTNNNNNDGVILVGDLKDDLKDGVTTETPYSDDLDTTTTLDAIRLNNEEEEEKARNGLGGAVTVTSRIPITHVVQTAASGMTNTLTVMYAGCLPPTLPVVGLQCAA